MKIIIPFLLFLAALNPGLGQETYTLSGYILTPCGRPVSGVNILGALSGTDGFYSVSLQEGEDYVVAPTYDGPYLEGVDYHDLAMLPQLVIGPSTQVTPYMMIAADLNNSKAITTLDILEFNLLLQGIGDLPNAPSWRFLPTDYVFPFPNDPWFENTPELVNLNGVSEDLTLNFIGIKTGDLDCSAAPWAVPIGYLSGQVVWDDNDNCQAENGESGLEAWVIKAESPDGTYFTNTIADGLFHMELPIGNYQVSVTPPSPIWAACDTAVPLVISEGLLSSRDFAVQSLADCPYMEVDISPLSLRRCTTNTYQLQYCNTGSSIADNAYVEVTFDSYLSVQGSSLPWSSSDGQIYTFLLGSLPADSCASFTIQADLSCDALLGQAHCVEAHIFPDSLCSPLPGADGPRLELTSKCIGDSVQFLIRNEGRDMPASRHFIVIEDDLVMFDGQFRLDADEDFQLSLPATGATLRLQLEPLPGTGAASQPGLAVEACGPVGPGGPSLGFVSQYPNPSGNPFIDINCRENTGPFDPNDKQAFPKGQGPNQFLHPTSGLEYLIRFQNTGTDTAFLVVIRDTLPAGLAPESVCPGAASHPYTFIMRGERILEFRFDNIMLPDSNINLEGSQGFVQFYVAQQPGNPNGTFIENNAAIYFDYNEPIITNYAWHTIDDGFMITDEASIEGELRTPFGDLLGDSAVVFLSQGSDTIATDTGGLYHFDVLPTMQDYTVSPYRNDDPFNGVSTFDIVLIARHILGVNPFVNPYQLLAADINYSGTVTTMDMVALRKWVLQIEEEPLPPGTTSWRFVRADYVFPDPANPWLEPIPATATFEPLLYDELADFIGIKIGDLNGDAVFGLRGVEGREPIPFALEYEEESGLFAATTGRSGAWAAFQMAFQLAEGQDVEAIQPGVEAGELAWSVSEQGVLRLCWYHTEAVHFEKGAPLFFIKMEGESVAGEIAPQAVLPHFNRAFTTEGIARKLQLEEKSSIPAALHIFPNPGTGAITVSTNIQEEHVLLCAYAPTGDLVLQAENRGAGPWAFTLPAGSLPAGVYTIVLQAGGQRFVERLVVLW